MKDKFSEWLKKIQKVHPKADEEVLRFIYDFSVKQGYGEAEDVLYQQFASGYCYYFACMLKAAFNRGEVCWAAPYGHIVWVDENDIPYDTERFRVLRKVGMEDTQIKKTINAQILLVFFMPLALAGLHLTCAYPMISKLIVLFTITYMTLINVVTCITFVMIGVFYGIVYKLTSHTYYKIIRS